MTERKEMDIQRFGNMGGAARRSMTEEKRDHGRKAENE